MAHRVSGVVLAALSLVGAATNVDLKVFSKEELMATMTMTHATKLVMNSHRMLMRPKLLALLETEFGMTSNGTMDASRAVTVQHHVKHAKTKGNHSGEQLPANPTGYGALDGARDMLNEMMDDAMAKLDNEVERCGTYNRETLAMLEQIRQDVASFNAQAAEARGRVLESQGTIAFCQLKLPQVQQELQEHNEECAREEASLNAQIGIVEADLEVMGGILNIIGDCSANAVANLLQCRHCRKTNEGMVMLQNGALQATLKKLRDARVKSYVRDGLKGLFDEAAAREEPQALTQEEVRRQVAFWTKGRGLRGEVNPNDPEMIASLGNMSLNISAVPEATVPYDCVPTNKCTLGKGSCAKIRDRFLLIQAGIQDLLTTIKHELAELQRTCLEDRTNMEAQIANLGEKLRVAQTELAQATKDQVDSESSSNLKAQQHTEISHEYGVTMKECCDNQNDLKSEICALEKIRGELYKMKGWTVFITDCEVSDWADGECSASCGGGSLTKTRDILVHPVNGMACPPLEIQDTCNTHPCPIDCIVGEWEEWSGCSAECGGGVRERMRPVVRESRYDGEPCEDTEETEGCNSFDCNEDCHLSEWSDWGVCSQACWSGTSRRDRGVEVPARGTGHCEEPTSEHRLQFRPCNEQSCEELYQPDGSLHCQSKVDMIVLMDGSGSLGEHGWQQSQIFVQNLISNLEGSDDHVHVALQVFSGPTTWDNYYKCIGQGDAPDMEQDCHISWISHFTNETLRVAQLVWDLEFPSATTLTSVALAEAESELINGREDAASIVVVVTDGKPMSVSKTLEAADALKQKARVIWVPVGASAPMEMIEELASLPKEENIIHIDDFGLMSLKFFSNKVIAHSCPELAPRKTCRLDIWEHDNREGRHDQFVAPEKNYVDFSTFTRVVGNDQVSSLEVTGPANCRATLFQHGDYSGWQATFGPGYYSFDAMVKHGAPNDDASTARVWFDDGETLQ